MAATLTKEQYFILILSGNSQEEIAAGVGITVRSLQTRIKRWGISDSEDHEAALNEYCRSLPTPASPIEVHKHELELRTSLPLIDRQLPFSDQLQNAHAAAQRLTAELAEFRGRARILHALYESMSEIASALYADTAELFSEPQAAKKMRYLYSHSNREYRGRLRNQMDEQGWISITEP